jgi:inner membrane protein
MHRPGHYGAALLAAVPVAVALRASGAPVLALVALVGIPALTPLPDWDLHAARLDHRGVSHTLAFAVLVGCCLGAVGWLLSPSLPGGLAPPRPLPVAVSQDLAWFSDRLPPPAASSWRPPVLAALGFTLGTTAVLAHLAADALTPAGVPLWWPVSDRRMSLGLVGASHRLANYGLLGAGTVAAALTLGVRPG